MEVAEEEVSVGNTFYNCGLLELQLLMLGMLHRLPFPLNLEFAEILKND